MGIMLVLMIFLQVPLTNSEKGAVLNGIPHSCQLNHSEMKINGVIVRKQACDTSSERIYAGCNKDTVADGIKRRCPSTLACYPVWSYVSELLAKAVEETNKNTQFLKYSEDAARMIFDMRTDDDM